MKLQISVLLYYCFSVCEQFKFSNARALIGQNVRPASGTEFLFVVSILHVNNEGSELITNRLCSGTLISKKDVLTAAHCLIEKEPNSIRIIIGSTDIRLGTTYFSLWWITYNAWIASKNLDLEFKDNDVAVIRLTKSVPDNIRPAVISTIENVNLYGLDVAIAAWGKSNNGEFPMILEAVSLKVLTDKECEVRAKKLDGLTGYFPKRLLCTAADPYAQISFGDSGGPLLYQNQVIGINHGVCLRTDLIFHPEKMNLHFGINYYRNFILDIINNHN